MGKMKRIIAILGTLLTTAILLSGSAVAQSWHWVNWIDYEHVTARNNINGAPDGDPASLGEEPRAVLGWILLDLGSGNEMGPNQNFTVFANSTVEEYYDVYVSKTPDIEATEWVGQGTDVQNETFYTPSDWGSEWRYIFMEGYSGVPAIYGGDYAYGPDIDAVGWYG